MDVPIHGFYNFAILGILIFFILIEACVLVFKIYYNYNLISLFKLI